MKNQTVAVTDKSKNLPKKQYTRLMKYFRMAMLK